MEAAHHITEAATTIRVNEGYIVVSVSLRDWLETGLFGPLRFGMPRTRVQELLGQPTDTSARPTKNPTPTIWKYGDIELHFDAEGSLSLVYLDHFYVPSGGGALVLDPWVVRGGMACTALEKELDESGIKYHLVDSPFEDNTTRIVVGPCVELVFTERAEPYSSPVGLFSIACWDR